jgi:flagellar motor switch/type III secretory pathway protein FliN
MTIPQQEVVPIELRTCRPPAPLGYPTPSEQQALEAFAVRLAAVLEGALSSKGVTCACGGEVQVGEGWDREWAAEAAWRQGALWRLRLSQGAAEAILAAQLGQDELTAHALTELDLRIMGEALGGLAREIGRELEGRGGAAEVAMSLAASPLPGEPLVIWTMTVQHGSLEGEAALVTVWEELAEVLMPETEEGVLEVEVLHGAAVTIEALLPGPPLTAGELWGMQPGDVLKLGAVDRPSVVTANGQPFARGRAGARGETLAVNIQEIGE